MRKIILVRHATAEPERYPIKDFDRNLDETGINESQKLGRFIKSKKEAPFQIYSSSANRTSQTSKIIIHETSMEMSNLQLIPTLYNAGYQILLSLIQAAPNSCPLLVVVGHNPGISQIATVLSNQESYQLSPGSALCLEFNCSLWKDISGEAGKETWYFIP